MKMTSLRYLPITLAALLFGAQANAQQFQSGEQQVPLIELYTSEGCSSCPPADRWMSKLKQRDDLWSGFVPVALHVDYWDYIGWKDPFASREFSQRQRQYAAEYKESTVYTPGIRKAGEEWRSWRLLGQPNAPKAPRVGKLLLDIDDQGEFSASFNSVSSSAAGLQLNIAVLGLELITDVKRGENRGKTLTHDFVVLELSRFAGADAGKWQGAIDKPAKSAGKYAVAAWISEKGRTTPIQATGGYLGETLWSGAL